MVNHLRELYGCRALLGTLVGRELKARYRASWLGFLWTFLNPLFFMAIYFLVFGLVMKQGGGRAYIAYLLTGLLPWIWFSSSLLEGAQSIVAGGNLVTKVVLPPQVLPATVVVSNLVHFLVSLPLLLALLAWFRAPLGGALLWLPVLIALQAGVELGLVLLLSSLTVRFRDLTHILGHATTLWFFATPVVYAADRVPARWSWVLEVNPMALAVDGYHRVLLEGRGPSGAGMGLLALFAAGLLALGVAVFERQRDSFAQEIG